MSKCFIIIMNPAPPFTFFTARALKDYALINATSEALDAFSQSARKGKGLEAFAVLKLNKEGMDSCVGLYFGVVIP